MQLMFANRYDFRRNYSDFTKRLNFTKYFVLRFESSLIQTAFKAGGAWFIGWILGNFSSGESRLDSKGQRGQTGRIV
jgi:hypothetical protein